MTYVETLTNAQPNLTLYGGKGSNLIEMIKLGINVPPGFILNTNAYRKFLENSNLREEISKSLSTEYSPKDILIISNKIRESFLKSQIPYEVIKEIKKAYDEICLKFNSKISFSVRSSANIEDSSKFSFAGQAESYLNIITFKKILESIKNCWISLYSPNALLYLLHLRKNAKNLSLMELEMSVIIQKLVKSHISGVLFTANVINNATDEMLINSTWGLGDTITGNLIIPDLVIINKNKFDIIKYVIGEKEKISLPNPEGSSTILTATEQKFRKQSSLNESQLLKLYNLGLKLEKHFKYPQDIEWAIENDKIYALQSRPITTLRN